MLTHHTLRERIVLHCPPLAPPVTPREIERIERERERGGGGGGEEIHVQWIRGAVVKGLIMWQ